MATSRRKAAYRAIDMALPLLGPDVRFARPIARRAGPDDLIRAGVRTLWGTAFHALPLADLICSVETEAGRSRRRKAEPRSNGGCRDRARVRDEKCYAAITRLIFKARLFKLRSRRRRGFDRARAMAALAQNRRFAAGSNGRRAQRRFEGCAHH